MYDKRYKGEGWSYWNGSGKLTKIVTVRLSDEELEKLKSMYPGKGAGYAIRSLIHQAMGH